jgi:hypothetical protein
MATDLRSAGCLEGFPGGSLAGSPAVGGQTGDRLADDHQAAEPRLGDHLAAGRSLLGLLAADRRAMAPVALAGDRPVED